MSLPFWAEDHGEGKDAMGDTLASTTAKNRLDFNQDRNSQSRNGLQRERHLIYGGSLDSMHSKVDPAASHEFASNIVERLATYQNETIVPVTTKSW